MSWCNYPLECTLKDTASTSWDWGVVFTPKMGNTFEVGISGGYGKTTGMAAGHMWTFQPMLGQCGYFTFVPIKKTSW